MESLREYSERHVLSTRGWTEWRYTGHSSSSERMGQQSDRIWEDSSRITGQGFYTLDLSKVRVGQYISPIDIECTQVHLKSIQCILKMDVVGNLLKKVSLISTLATIKWCKICILICQLWSLSRTLFCIKT